ncbi:MAG: hypothetical protein VW683_14475 [Betaproteobacteria bacterium]
MKLSNAINNANKFYVATTLGAGVSAFAQIEKAEAKKLLDYWSDTEDDGHLRWSDDSGLEDGTSFLSEVATWVDGDLVIGHGDN